MKYIIDVDKSKIDCSGQLFIEIDIQNSQKEYAVPTGIWTEPYEQQSAYQKGLDDAWDAARKICKQEEDGGLTEKEVRTIFGVSYYLNALNVTASEAIAKLHEYEEQKDRIEVGDEVKIGTNTPDMEPMVVTAIMKENYEDLLCMSIRGKYTPISSKRVVKTGRYFPEIAEVLKQMQEGQE